MNLVSLLVHIESFGGIHCDKWPIFPRKKLPADLKRLVEENEDLLLRYFHLREKALELQAKIDPADGQMLPEEERLRLLKGFNQFVEAAEKLETEPLNEPARERRQDESLYIQGKSGKSGKTSL